jgi:hypothetical protein
MKFSVNRLLTASALLMLTLPAIVAGQQSGGANPKDQSSLTGKYEGMVKDSTGEAKFTLDLVEESGKFSGAIITSLGVFKVVKGQIIDGTLTLEFETKGSPHSLTVRQKGDMWVGTALDAGKTPAVEMRKVKADEISGEWDAAADVQGQPFPFTLSLKVEGEKVTGSSSSQLGTSTISSGAWKEGKLAIVLDSANGAIGLIATLTDGKLVGDYDYAGQLQGKWVAVRKK